jgi:hypothetical protein
LGELTECEGDGPVHKLACKAAVAVEDVAGEHALGRPLAEWRESWVVQDQGHKGRVSSIFDV